MIDIVGFLISAWCYASLAGIAAVVFWVWLKERSYDGE